MNKIIGRMNEQKILDRFLTSDKAEFMAVYGRRRVGKSFLLKNYFRSKKCLFFDVTGIQGGTLENQILAFMKKIGDVFYPGAPIKVPKTWWDAFDSLHKALEKNKSKKVVILLDEFPWMATRKSGLLRILEHYWNDKWNWDKRIKLVVCGSSSSWIIKKIINNTGGLYRRVTAKIELHPYTLKDAQQLLRSKGIRLNHQQILEIYMVTGGIPLYLNYIEKGLSAQQNINALCFERGGFLRDEFTDIFHSLFDESTLYIELVKHIAQYREGISKHQLIKLCHLPLGGRASERLNDLEEAGFITSFIPYGHRERGIYYKIIDEYTLFYFHWIEPDKAGILNKSYCHNTWQRIAEQPAWKSWSGYAFEAICYKHLDAIKRTLGIDSIFSQIGSWRYAPSKKDKNATGAQIDLLFDRDDGVVTICEMKYSQEPFVIDKQYAANLLNKVKVYQKRTKTKKQLFLAMISANGLKPTMYSEEIISGQVTLDDLFQS